MNYPKYEDDLDIVFHGFTYFAYSHLPEPLQSVSKPFAELAKKLVTETFKDWRELSEEQMHEVQKSLDALLIAKDAAVRAALPPGKARI